MVMPILITVFLIISAFIYTIPSIFLAVDGALIAFVNTNFFSGNTANFNVLQMIINGIAAVGSLLLFYKAKTRVGGLIYLLIATFFSYSLFRFSFYYGYELDLKLVHLLQLAFLTGTVLILTGYLKSKFNLSAEF